MKREEILRNFLEILRKKIPRKSKLTTTLMNLLFIEKGAVNRRLRGEVPFSFYEVVSICEKLNIPLNSLIVPDPEMSERFVLSFIEYTDTNERDFKFWDDYLSFVHAAKNDPLSEIEEASNTLPVTLFAGFDWLTKYYIFKYQYRLHEKKDRKVFGDLEIPDRWLRIFRSYYDESKYFAKTTYIIDSMIFQNLVSDIRFFSDICLIGADDIAQIKHDLTTLLDYIEKIAFHGYFEETKNPVFFYISDVSLEADYTCAFVNDTYSSTVRTFLLNYVQSNDRASYMTIKDWIHSLKESSTLITQTGAMYRTDFFEKQRRIVAEL